MNIIKTYRYRIYPNKRQLEVINNSFELYKIIYNNYLKEKIKMYEKNKKIVNYLSFIDSVKKTFYEFLNPVAFDISSLEYILKSVDYAFQKCIKFNKYPKYKSYKDYRKSFKIKCQNNIYYSKKYLNLPFLGNIRTRNNLPFEGKELFTTLIKEPSGKYFLSICAISNSKTLEKKYNSIGIDLGINEYLTTSSGITINNPKYYDNSYEKLVKIQKSLSRKNKGSSNYNKQRMKLARVQEHIANQRKDFLNKLSYNLVKENDIICLENLQVKNMMKNKKLSKSISDVSWSSFINMLEYKSLWYDKKVIKIDTYYPSSQKCHTCGYINKTLKDLSIRFWECPKCHMKHDRDLNASINILNEGLKILKNK